MAINTTSVYYVDGSRVAINWGSAVSGGVATIPIFRLVVVDGHENINLWAYTGDAVSSAASTAAQAEITGGGVPVRVKPQAEFGPAQGSETFRQKAGVTGAYALDTKGANIFELTLTGNVSALTLSNIGSTGRVIELHFVQDGTGSRTLAGLQGTNVKLAGGALTLTTAAGKRDVIRLRNVGGGKLVELSRSLNL